VYISYGYKNNDRLLELYGFVEQYNPLEDYTVDDLFELFEDYHHAEQHAPLIEGDDVAGTAMHLILHEQHVGVAFKYIELTAKHTSQCVA
jgi:hypothetical protein